MAVVRLSNSAVDGASWDPDGPQTQYLWDTQVSGFGVRLSPAGNKSYVISYRRSSDYRRRFLTLGPCSRMSVQAARLVAKDFFARIVLGGDPLAEKQARQRGAKTAPTLRDLRERYAREIETRNKKTTRWVKATAWSHILEHFGEGTRVADLSRDDVLGLFEKLSENRPSGANRVVQILSHALRLAAEHWTTPEGGPWYPHRGLPTSGIRLNPERVRQRSYSADELQRLCAGSRELELRHPAAMVAIRLLALTGARAGELCGTMASAQWSNYDAAHRVFLLPESKADRQQIIGRRIYIPESAMPDLERLSAMRRSNWLVPGIKSDRPLSKSRLNDWWLLLVQRAGVGTVGEDRPTLHILRHTFQTTAASLRLAEYERGFLMGHRPDSAKMTKKYTHLPHSFWLERADEVGAELARMAGISK